jgi:hypothetical protein
LHAVGTVGAADEHAKLCAYYARLSHILADYYNPSQNYYSHPKKYDEDYRDPEAALKKLKALDVPDFCRPLTYAKVNEFFEAKKALLKKEIDEFSKDKTAYIKNTILKISPIKEGTGLLHLNRIYWTFFRITLGYSLVETQIPDAAAIKQFISIPNEACNVGSAGLLYFRFLINVSLIAKHVHFSKLFQGTKGRTEFKEELYDELDKRGVQMMNDIVWGTVNLLTNFDASSQSLIGQVIDMGSVSLPFVNASPIPVASIVTAAFLLFDVALNTYQWRYRDLPKYKRDKARLENELNGACIEIGNQTKQEDLLRLNQEFNDELENIKTGLGDPSLPADWTKADKYKNNAKLLDIKAKIAQREAEIYPANWASDPRYYNAPSIIIAKAKLDELKASWVGKSWSNYINVGAAFFLLGGFTASMFFTGGMAIPICFAAVLFGTAMYFCADSVGNLMAARRRVVHAEQELKDLERELASETNKLAMDKNELRNEQEKLDDPNGRYQQLKALCAKRDFEHAVDAEQIDAYEKEMHELEIPKNNLERRINELEKSIKTLEERIPAIKANIKDVEKDRSKARWAAAESIGRNFIMPGLILGVGAFCWQGALAIAVAYAVGLLMLKAYRWYNTPSSEEKDAWYEKHNKAPAATPPVAPQAPYLAPVPGSEPVAEAESKVPESEKAPASLVKSSTQVLDISQAGTGGATVASVADADPLDDGSLTPGFS